MKKSRHVRAIIISAISISLFALLVSCGGGGDSGSAAGESGSITLTVVPTTKEILADGSSSATITATVKDSAGNPVRNFTDVNFSTTLGHFRNGSSSYTVQTQPPIVDGKIDPKADPTGIVVVSLTSGTSPGTANVTVSSNSVTNLVRITFTHAGNTGVPVGEAFSLSAAYLNISGLWVVSLEDKITASVGDVYGNAVKDSTLIAFKTYNTGGIFGTDTVPTSKGIAESNLYSAVSPTPLQGFVSLTAETTGGSTTRVTAIEVAPSPDYHIMYAGTNGGGVYKSTDYGATWLTVSRSTENPKQGQNLIYPYIRGHSTISVDPDNHNSVYVGTGYLGKGNVYHSLDGGMNWNSNNVEQWNGLYNTTAAVLSVLCDGSTSSSYVWIGTEGLGPLYATDGKTFQPSGSYASTPVAGSGNTGNGTMSQPVVSYSSISETWTATYVETAGTATTPAAASGNTGNGTISSITTSTTTKTEDWTVTYAATAGTVTPGSRNVGDGTVSSIVLTKPNAASEEWTLTAIGGAAVVGTVTSYPQKVSGDCLSLGTVTGIEVSGTITAETFTLTNLAAETLFSVASDVRGTIGTATTGTEFSAAGVKFTISAAEYVEGETFIFFSGSVTDIAVTEITATEVFTLTCNKGGTGTTATFDVVSDKRGSLGTATAGTEFSASGVTLTISAAGSAANEEYSIGDYFTFTATLTAGATFSVVSDEGGAYPNATVGTAYSQNGLAFLINAGGTPFVDGDIFQFTTTAAWQVTGMVSGVQTDATTGTAYTSAGGEVGFTISAGTTAFVSGDKFTFSTTAGSTSWTVEGTESGTQTNRAYNGQGYYSDEDEIYFLITEGSTAFADGDTFTFTVTASELTHGWTVWDIVKVPDTHGDEAKLYAGTATGVYKTENGAQTWSSLISFTGDYVIALALYPTATGEDSDIIYAGTQNGGVWVSANSGSTWTQYITGMDEGKGATIKDLVVDPANHRLYAIVYTGPADKATGNLYVHTLNSNGTMASGQWSKANTGLSGTALYALAANIPSSPTALFVGGEGINLYKATSGLDTGSPSWAASKSGLSNLIMARMPILFSGQCAMTVSRAQSGSTVSFTVYIEDVNGNPPITGSTFTATHTPETGTEVVLKNIKYADTYTAYGTFRDPADSSTKLPYTFSATVSSGDKIELVFTPANTLPDAPGSSGSTQTSTYTY